MTITIPITVSPSESLTWEALEKCWKELRKASSMPPDRWHYVKALTHIDDSMKKGTLLVAKEFKFNSVCVARPSFTYGTVLPSSLANIFLEPTDLFVDEEEDKEMDTQWFAMRSLMKD